MDHYDWDRIENILQRGDKAHWSEFLDWTIDSFSRIYEWDRKQKGFCKSRTLSIRFYKSALGRQDTCVVFLHRCWVWTRPKEGWTLYVDRRGPALHVQKDMTPQEAWDAFVDFRERIDSFLSERSKNDVSDPA